MGCGVHSPNSKEAGIRQERELWFTLDAVCHEASCHAGLRQQPQPECYVTVHARVHGDIALWLWLLAQPSVARGFVADSIKREPQLTLLSDASFFAIEGGGPGSP